jgi:thiosulfate dehydrogenase
MRTILLLSLCLAGCSPKAPERVPITREGTPDSLLRGADGSPVPTGEMGRSIRRGHAILAATPDSLPNNVGSSLRCISCHLGDGRQDGALPLVGAFARFPQYRARAGRVQLIEDRVNDCLLRSLNGKALPLDDPSMRDIVAYLAFMARGIAVSDPGPPRAEGPSTGDTIAGSKVFLSQCARCHGANGAGMGAFPPLWGEKSFNIGAGMARVRTAHAFILHNMPQDRPGSLSDIDALNVAAYVMSRPRPDFAGKERDWPNGDAPPDAPYKTTAKEKMRK